ncbi:MAG: alpha/beta hydrolase [Salaquimonas sp.]|nr:alpha/beta hydrolase [Salaquimonas sp.]
MAGGSPDWRAGELDSPTGATLRLYSMKPEGEPKAIIQINHGMAEHAARYERFARFLAGHGCATFAHDHRGHGATTAPDAPLGVFAVPEGKGSGWSKVIADVGAVNRHVHGLYPEIPIICFGHSMGGIIAFDYCLTHPESIAGAAIWNTSLDTPALLGVLAGILKVERFFKGSDTPSAMAVALTFSAWNKHFKPNRTEFDWLSRDEAEVDKYVADPLCGFPVAIGTWLSVLEGIYFGADDRNLVKLPRTLPFHLSAGGDDPVSERGKAIEHLGERLGKAGLSDVTVIVRPSTRHEALNEINREEIMEEFGAWLAARFS